MNDTKGYIERLDKTMTRKEKLFFFNKVNWNNYDCIVDFGGANGRLLYEVDKYLTKHKKDKNNKIQLFNIERNADIEHTYNYNRQYFHAFSLQTFTDEMLGKRVLLILSSVLHEVDEETLWNIGHLIVNFAHTVVIRDMYFYIPKWIVKSEENKADNFFEKFRQLLCPNDQRLFLDVVRYSRLSRMETLYEFFLKYTYLNNWSTECQEAYFGRPKDSGYHKNNVYQLCKSVFFYPDFRVTYCKHYLLPYKKKQVLKEFSY